MSAYYALFALPLSKVEPLRKLASRLYKENVTLTPLGEEGSVMSLASESELATLLASFSAFANDLPLPLKGLIIPFIDSRFLPYLSKVADGELLYLEEIGLTPSDYESFLPLLEGIDDETLLTVKTYIETNGSPSLSALRLYVHHNTVSYRLSRFEEKTNLSLEGWSNAMFVYELLKAQIQKNGPFVR
jgi:hypothetical protein